MTSSNDGDIIIIKRKGELFSGKEKAWDKTERPFYLQCGACQHKMRGFTGRRDNPWYWKCDNAPDVMNGIGVLLPDGSIGLKGYDPRKSTTCSIRNIEGNCPMFEQVPLTRWQIIIATLKKRYVK